MAFSVHSVQYRPEAERQHSAIEGNFPLDDAVIEGGPSNLLANRAREIDMAIQRCQNVSLSQEPTATGLQRGQ